MQMPADRYQDTKPSNVQMKIKQRNDQQTNKEPTPTTPNEQNGKDDEGMRWRWS